MYKKIVGLLAIFVLFDIGAYAQTRHPEVISMVQDCFSSGALSATANTKSYGSVIDCRNVEWVSLMISFTQCDSTTQVAVGIENLPENVDNSLRRNPITDGEEGAAITSGWAAEDLATTTTYTATDDVLVTFAPQAPYIRPIVHNKIADSDATIRVRYCLRYTKME